jgi:hypothetical protein
MPHPYVHVSKMTESDIYCGRARGGIVPAPPHRGWLGNPIKRDEPCFVCSGSLKRTFHYNPGGTLDCYARYLWHRIQHDEAFYDALKDVARRVKGGARLACFCSCSKHCHTSMIAKAIDYCFSDAE